MSWVVMSRYSFPITLYSLLFWGHIVYYGPLFLGGVAFVFRHGMPDYDCNGLGRLRWSKRCF